MAPKRVHEIPPNVSSSSDDEEEFSEETPVGGNDEDVTEGENEEQSEEEEMDEDEKSSMEKPISTLLLKRRKNSVSESESDSSSDSDADSEKTLPSPNVSDFTIKPILSKPVSDLSKPLKMEPKRRTIVSGLKRVAGTELNGGKESNKKKKVVNGGEDEDGKKGSGFQRLWSEDDEIVILKGMVEYQYKKGMDPYADMGAFHEFIKKSLHVDVSKNQLTDKIRRLKKKFQNNVDKGGNGEDPFFTKPHEHKTFEISKKIWGEANNNVDESVKKIGKAKQSGNKVNKLTLNLLKHEVAVKKESVLSGDGKIESTEFAAKYPYLSASMELRANSLLLPESVKGFVRENMSLMGVAKANELDAECKKLKVAELELCLKRVDLVREQLKSLLDAMNSPKAHGAGKGK